MALSHVSAMRPWAVHHGEQPWGERTSIDVEDGCSNIIRLLRGRGRGCGRGCGLRRKLADVGNAGLTQSTRPQRCPARPAKAPRRRRRSNVACTHPPATASATASSALLRTFSAARPSRAFADSSVNSPNLRPQSTRDQRHDLDTRPGHTLRHPHKVLKILQNLLSALLSVVFIDCH